MGEYTIIEKDFLDGPNVDYLIGREARKKGVPRSSNKNIDWLLGWDEVQADYDAEDAEAKWRSGQEP